MKKLEFEGLAILLFIVIPYTYIKKYMDVVYCNEEELNEYLLLISVLPYEEREALRKSERFKIFSK